MTIETTISQAIDDIVTNFKILRPVLFVGPVGVGKTDAIRQAAAAYAKETGKPFPVIDRRASQMDATDLTLPMPDEASGRIRNFVPDWLPRVDRDGDQGVILLDELTDAQIATQAGFNQLILERELPGYRLPDGWRVAATGNRTIDRAAAGRVSRATANRFAVMVAMVDAKAWVAWAMGAGIAPELIAYIQQAIVQGLGDETLHKYPDSTAGDATPFPTPRSIAACSPYLLPSLGLSVDAIRRQVAYNTGEDWAQGFMAFLRSYRLAPDLQLILSDPKSAPVHADSAINYALAVGLAGRMDTQNVDAIATYAKRMPAEQAAALWQIATSRTDAVGDTTMGEMLMETKQHVQHMMDMRNAGM